MLKHPTRWFLAVTVGASALLAAGLWWFAGLGWLPSWLAAINMATGLAFLYDKAAAKSERRRVPERVLLALALVGGSPAAFAAMQFSRHKTAKQPFQRRFWFLVTIQVIAIAAYCLAVGPSAYRMS
jgi:uncharacterized membrane protein YsdA (DUF1294 family)